jgi:hypothetical protein
LELGQNEPLKPIVMADRLDEFQVRLDLRGLIRTCQYKVPESQEGGLVLELKGSEDVLNLHQNGLRGGAELLGVQGLRIGVYAFLGQAHNMRLIDDGFIGVDLGQEALEPCELEHSGCCRSRCRSVHLVLIIWI